MIVKKIKDAIGVDTCNLAAKRDFIALKFEVEKLDINKFVNFPTGLNNLKTQKPRKMMTYYLQDKNKFFRQHTICTNHFRRSRTKICGRHVKLWSRKF